MQILTKQKERRCKSFRWSILKNFSLLIAITAVAFIIAFFTVIYTQSTMVFSNIVNKVVMDLENDLKKFFNPVSNALVILSRFATVQETNRLNEEKINRVLIPILKDFPQISAAQFADNEGLSFILRRQGSQWISQIYTPAGSERLSREVVRDNHLTPVSRKPLTTGSHLKKKTWFQQASKAPAGKLVWTDPYISELDGKLVITVATSARRSDGGPIVMAFNIALEHMPGISQYKDWKMGGVTFVMTDDRKFIGLTGTKLLTGDKPNDLVIVSLSDLNLPMLRDAVRRWEKPRKWNDRPRKKDDNLLFFSSDDERAVGTIHPFHLCDETTIWIGHVMPVENLKNFEHYFRQLSVIPIVFILALVLALWLTKKMSRNYITPLTKLVEQSSRISRMDLKPGEPIESNITELQQLADSHEQMRSALEKTTTDLKISNEKLEAFSQTLSDKVEERTLELQEKSHELEELNETLEIKVKQEVEASDRKDQIMLQSARQAQMGEMISMIAHQWRQPLSSISTVTGNMLVNIELENYEKEPFKEMLSSINEHAQFLSHTINDFRNFFKPNKDKESIRLDSALEQTISIIGKSLSYKSIELKREYQFSTPLETYPNELTQVFLNIIKNAQDILLENQIEYPVITINGWEEANYQIVQITDNAGGIPADIMDKIFEPYFSTKGEKTGTGLGLYMSKLIIEKHCQGELVADNVANGARFTIRLPQES